VQSAASERLPKASVTPGAMFRVTAVASAVAVSLVVVSAVVELGTAHWGLALVALPLLVANVVVARIAYPALLVRATGALVALLVAIGLGGVVAWSGDAAWAVALHVGVAATAALGLTLLVAVGAYRGGPAPFAARTGLQGGSCGGATPWCGLPQPFLNPQARMG